MPVPKFKTSIIALPSSSESAANSNEHTYNSATIFITSDFSLSDTLVPGEKDLLATVVVELLRRSELVPR